MSKKPSGRRATSNVQDVFGPAIEKADVRKVQELIGAGHKPNAEAARQAVDACIKASNTARMTKRPVFGRMPSKT